MTAPRSYRVPVVRVQLVRDSSCSVPRVADHDRAAAAIVREIIGDADREHFAVLGLDNRNRVIAAHVAAVGTESQCLVSPSIILRAALLMGCPAFVIAHNHPSGDPTPSSEDRATTARLLEGARAVGLILVDHVVIGESASYFSFLSAGLL